MLRTSLVRRCSSVLPLIAFSAVLTSLLACAARATPAVTMDVATGDVLYAQEATRPWYPASTTKLMTVYVALNAIKNHQIAMDTPLVVSPRAHSMPPSKMGFPVGTQVTLDNALKMLMVRSANDIAITIAEGIGGTVEGFADDMNQTAAQLGLHESHFVNPNGLPDADHYSSARDMAIIARALYTEFPEQAQLFNLGALSLGREIIANHNNLLGRYPGVDGMKTGFTCSAGFNIVASAFRDGRRLVVVVFGAPSVSTRSSKVAALFDRGFAGIDQPSGSILTLAAANAGGPPDMRDHVCRNRAGLIAQFNSDVANLDAPLEAPKPAVLGLPTPERAFLFSAQNGAPPAPALAPPMATRINQMPQQIPDPVPVHIGADVGYTGPVAQARAPHTAIGSEPQPVAAMAYAAAPPPGPADGAEGANRTPLKVDTSALPMKGRKGRFAHARRSRATLKASAEAPKTKVIATADAGEHETAKAKPRKGAGAKQAIGDSDDGAAKAKKPVAKVPAKAISKKPTKAPARAAKAGQKVKAAAE